MRLSLFALWFSQQITASVSVQTRTHWDGDWAARADKTFFDEVCGQSATVAHVPDAGDTLTLDEQRLVDVACADGREFNELLQLSTLLELAKGNEFRRVCTELGFFLECLSKKSRADPDKRWRTGSRQECGVQCIGSMRSASACTDSHFAQSEKIPSDGCARWTVSLNELINGEPSHPEGPFVCQLQSGADTSMLDIICEGHYLQQLEQDIRHCHNLHPNTKMALDSVAAWNRHDSFSRVAIYTDGSYKEDTDAVGFAAVCLVEVHDEWQFVGYKAGAIHMNELLNKVTACAHVAELCGMIHAKIIGICVGDCVPVTIWYDCESAQQVMRFGSPKVGPLEAAASSIQAICQHLHADCDWRHVPGHCGDPWNECADVLAKYALNNREGEATGEPDVIVPMLCEEWAQWLWLCVAAEQDPLHWPAARHDGTFVAAGPSLRCQRPEAGQMTSERAQVTFHLLIASYNTLSLKAVGQSECLDHYFGVSGCCILGLQECRTSGQAVETANHFVRFSSVADNGHEGCQIWLSKYVHPGCDACGNRLAWELDSFSFHRSDPRCVAIVGRAGGQLFGIVSAHAPTSVSDPDVISAFWHELAETISKLPERAIKLVLLDANATFNAYERRGFHYAPVDANAEAMVEMLQKTGLCISDLWDVQGNEITTWRSPNGAEKALDFICVPQHLQGSLVTLGSDDGIRDLFSGIDHKPIWVETSFAIEGSPRRTRRKSFNCAAMQTLEGRAKLDRIFADAPRVPWGLHACDHWEILKSYMVDACHKSFPVPARKPRKPYVSDEMFQAICLQRQIRMELRHRNQSMAKRILHICLKQWSRFCKLQEEPWWGGDNLLERHRLWLKTHDFAVAERWKQLREVRSDIRNLARTCQAERAKEAFAEAREAGPRAIASLMANLMKMGRRYRPPRLLPPLVDKQGRVMACEEEVMAALGEHFAKAERATTTDLVTYREARKANSEVPPNIDGSMVPSFAELASAFRNTKAGKAAGPSGLVPDRAAMAVYPVFLKQLMRGEVPEDFLRSWIRPIPKPGKSLAMPTGWRSIALQEIPSKAISATFRRHLLQALDCVACPLQLGGRAGGPMSVPSIHVWGHLRRMRAVHQSAGVLFIDGVQAFYSVIRELVIGVEEGQDGIGRIIAVIESMHHDEQIRSDIFRLLCGPSILEQANAPDFVRSFLRQSMTSTFFQLQPGSDRVYTTTAGTVPGTPLADVVYQLAVVAFHRRLQERLEEAELLVAVGGKEHGKHRSQHHSSAATWVDDIALPVSAASAAALVPKIAKIAAIAEQALAVTGVKVNYGIGKTEAIVCFRGRGAAAVRRFWMVEQNAQVEVPWGPGKGAKLVLSTEYVHLGCRVQANGMSMHAIAHRADIAKPVFAALRKRLLFNTALSQEERTRLVVQGPMASLLHGSGLWDISHGRTAIKARDAIMTIFRQCVRPLTGKSCRGLTNDEVCQLIGVVSPAISLRHSRMRLAISIAGLIDEYLLCVLVEEQSWLCMVLGDWHHHGGIAWADLNGGVATREHGRSLFEFLRDNRHAMQAHLRNNVRKQLQEQQQGFNFLWDKVVRLDALYKQGALSFHPNGAWHKCQTPVACPECHRVVHGIAAMASHRSKVHGHSSLGAMLGDFTCCPICLTEFWTCERLWMHLRKAAICRLLFVSSDPDLEPSQKRSAEPARWPACRVSGPKPWWACLKISDSMREQALDPCMLSGLEKLTRAWFAFKDAKSDSAEWVLRTWSGVFQIVRECEIQIDALEESCLDDELIQFVSACQGNKAKIMSFHLIAVKEHFWVVPEQASHLIKQL